MFDPYFCIKTFFRSKPLEKLLEFFYPVPIMARMKHVTCERFENAASGAKINIIATVHVTDDDVSFCDGPGMIILKTAMLCINST